MKNILNTIADILTLLAICIAAIGHVLPWFDRNRIGFNAPDVGQWLGEFQLWHSARSGGTLAVLGVLICLSLIFNWGPTMRRLLNLAMFASAFSALLFELLIFSNYLSRGNHPPMQLNDTNAGFALAMVPTCFAVFFCLVRMLWTMPPTRPVRPEELDRGPSIELPPKESWLAKGRE